MFVGVVFVVSFDDDDGVVVVVVVVVGVVVFGFVFEDVGVVAAAVTSLLVVFLKKLLPLLTTVFRSAGLSGSLGFDVGSIFFDGSIVERFLLLFTFFDSFLVLLCLGGMVVVDCLCDGEQRGLCRSGWGRELD